MAFCLYVKGDALGLSTTSFADDIHHLVGLSVLGNELRFPKQSSVVQYLHMSFQYPRSDRCYYLFLQQVDASCERDRMS